MQKRLPQIQVLPKQQSLLKIKKGVLTSLKLACKMTVISDYILMGSFCFRPFMLCRERLECTFWCPAHIALPINSRFVVEFVLSLYSLWNNNKSMKKGWIRMAVKLVIVWMMSVVQSFNINHTLAQNIYEITQFKMTCGTCDLLWLISRLNTELHVIPSQVAIQLENGDLVDRVSPWIRYAVDPNDGTHLYVGIHWDPPQPYQWQNSKPKKTSGLRIYECHVGIASPDLRVASYKEFAYNVIPRIKKLGYNCIQLMAVMEHAYYACFGYQVTNFFAASR